MADSSSTSAFISTLIIYGLTALVFVWLFLLLRPKNRRVYEPRSLKDIQTIPEEERTEPVPEGYFGWVEYLLSKPHSFLIQHTSVDGYFLLRYIGIVGSLSFVGCLLLLPILLPVNATNGNNLQGFELLSFSNVTNKNRFYAHVFLSWIFFGLFIYVIYKELYYYVVFRHAMQTTPLYDGLLSSRTVIVTELHKSIAQEGEMQMRFPKASNVAFAYDLSDLQELCKERAKNAAKYEAALNKVLNKCVKMTRNKTQNNLTSCTITVPSQRTI
ncbi:AEL_HP2_G0045880.mRNA.1.CDS.1 [Saccharomyces cerevisiae]|nr:AEL_HP2_G0045880.mRNA.1.CDS.1 [Saccharomyces cerevisiae]CAI6757706.1 AEL_HP2_G0045880.mRNA.1.CDS.1 [Saccharomyces cerevisiae]CAI6803063.1 AEL_HP1_G0048150.mRNA.1.CDS.1 [Saccharomyces cerevisiae]